MKCDSCGSESLPCPGCAIPESMGKASDEVLRATIHVCLECDYSFNSVEITDDRHSELLKAERELKYVLDSHKHLLKHLRRQG